jgi:hypothetical protein
MAATTYRYRWTGVDPEMVRQNLAPQVKFTLLQPLPQPITDVILSSDVPDDKADLDAVMLVMGWEYVSTNPP